MDHTDDAREYLYRETARQKAELAARIKADIDARNAEARQRLRDLQDAANATYARNVLGPHFDEFVALMEFANERRPADAFVLRYHTDKDRAGFLGQVRDLLDQHKAMLMRGRP
jgi:hypothetical protein